MTALENIKKNIEGGDDLARRALEWAQDSDWWNGDMTHATSCLESDIEEGHTNGAASYQQAVLFVRRLNAAITKCTVSSPPKITAEQAASHRAECERIAAERQGERAAQSAVLACGTLTAADIKSLPHGRWNTIDGFPFDQNRKLAVVTDSDTVQSTYGQGGDYAVGSGLYVISRALRAEHLPIIARIAHRNGVVDECKAAAQAAI